MCNESTEPIYVTKNGYGDMVLMSMKAYEEKLMMLELYEKLAIAEEEVKTGRQKMALLRCKSCGKSTMYNITITDRADRELSDILEYLSVQLQNPTAATAFVEEVLSVYEALKHTPYMYELSHNLRLHRMGYHKVVIKNYVMLYRVDEQTQCVYVLHFFYGARQYEKLI